MKKHLFICTLEVDCWSRDLSYQDYKEVALIQGVTPLHEPVYKKVCEAMNLQLEIDCGKVENHD